VVTLRRTLRRRDGAAKEAAPQPAGPARRPGGLASASLKLAGLAVGGFFLGVLLFNGVVMPRLLGHGNEVQVPDVVGRPLSSAREVIAEHGLAVGSVNEHWNRVYPEGFVTAQAPAAQTAVKRGRELELTVSIGSEGQAVPDLTNVGYREAQVAVARAGLRVGQLVYTHSERMPKDAVVASDPEVNTQVETGARIDLLVSLGPPPATFVLPNFHGHRVDDVRTFLSRSGIRLVERQRSAEEAEPGTVLEQSPPAGYRIRNGELVEVAVVEGQGGWR
jgi:eukaryotic-like serine/threonine-protein kinase